MTDQPRTESEWLGKGDVCVWIYHEGSKSNVWGFITGCNDYLNGDSYEGDFTFCPFCGKPIDEKGDGK